MQIKRPQKNVCILLITFILLIGMCFDRVQTDSCLPYAASEISDELYEHTSSTLKDTHDTSFSYQIYSESILTRQVSSFVHNQFARRILSTKSGKGNSLAFFLLYLLPLLLSSILISDAYEFQPDIRNNSIIIQYIHHKDGKKSKLSF